MCDLLIDERLMRHLIENEVECSKYIWKDRKHELHENVTLHLAQTCLHFSSFFSINN
jgi:hypothetical protein